MHDVFISYSSVNKDIADAVCNRLESGGTKCWYAPRDVMPSAVWESAIMDAIGQAKIFVLVYSEDSNRSEHVTNEVRAAFKAQCTIIPFRVDQSQMSKTLSYYLDGVHWLDAITPPREANIEALRRYIDTILDRPIKIMDDGSSVDPPSPTPVPKRPSLAVILTVVVSAVLVIAMLIRGISPEAPDLNGVVRGSSTNPSGTAQGPLDRTDDPQTMRFFSLSDPGDYKYPFYSTGMMSVDYEQYFVTNEESGMVSLVRAIDGYRVMDDFQYDYADPLGMISCLYSWYNTIYFIEYDNGYIIKSYDRAGNQWINEEGTRLELSDTEYLENGFLFDSSLIYGTDHKEEMVLFVYDSGEDVDCISKLIRFYPDGSYSATEIGELGLRRSIACLSSPEYILMMDKSGHVQLVNIALGQVMDVSYQTILEEYLPDAKLDNREISESKRYIYVHEGDQAIVWDLETGEAVFDEIMYGSYYLLFSGPHEIAVFDSQTDCLYTCDLQTGRKTVRLEKEYFEENEAFLDIPYSFYYSDVYDVCFFVSSKGFAEDGTYVDMVTVTDLEGNILAVSEELESRNGNHYADIYVQDGFVLLDLYAADVSQTVEDGIYTYLYRALFTVDENGNMLFSDSYI